ncbi:MAG: sulfatase [Clostridia bacterium]|nr:sulfatase-like hydrolase/transferase [Spirochaetia bacterium]
MSASGSRPNIVLIMTDQQRYDTIRALGYPYMDTPNLDRLVNEGVSFTNHFVTSASCSPSRASFFTGYYPHTTGIYKNADVWKHSWVENLADAGYHCVNIGKMHTYPYETPLGFHERFVVENKDRYLEGRWFFDRWDMACQARGVVKQQREIYRTWPGYKDSLGAFEWKMDEDLHSDFFVGNMAKYWLQNKPAMDKPFFLQIGFPGPHPPYDPPKRYADPYMKKDLPLPAVSEEEKAAQPPAQKMLREENIKVDHDSVVWKENPSAEELKRMRAYYYANVTMIDEKIGDILKTLDEKGYLENSIVIFTSDHGDCMGDHGHIEKWVMYDEITRTPMIVWGPAYFQGGRKVDDLIQQFDLVPALFELAGVQQPAGWEAKSLLPFLKEDPKAKGREYVFAEQSKDPTLQGTEFMTMVRNREWKLVHYLGENQGGELYDLAKDPKERNNLWNDLSYADKKRELLDVLLSWRIRSDVATEPFSRAWR